MKTKNIATLPILAVINISKARELSLPDKSAVVNYAYHKAKEEGGIDHAENFLNLCNKTVASVVRMHYLNRDA